MASVSTDDAIAPEVFAYAMQLASVRGTFNATLWADILLWPRSTKSSPPYWKTYCDQWEALHALPRGLNGVAAAGILHVITSAMREDGSTLNCFLGLQTVAQRAHVSRRTVQRVLAWQRDAPAPLIAIATPGATRGMVHACYRFTLVKDPPAFVAGRQTARAREVAKAQERLQAARPDELEDQKEVILGRLSETAYSERKAARVATARGTLPKRVKLPSTAIRRGANLAPIDTAKAGIPNR